MREYIAEFMKEYDYPPQAQECLMVQFDLMRQDAGLNQILEAAICDYTLSEHIDYSKYLEKLESACARCGINHYAPHLIFYICLTRRMKYYYYRDGIPMQIFKDTVLDLRCKLIECRNVKGEWGTFVGEWFAGFFRLKRFALGRLQFEPIELEDKYEKCGVSLKEGDICLTVHIPSLGPLLAADYAESYARAERFFAKNFPGGTTVFYCSSWLLYPKNREILKENSNIVRFMSDFDIYKSCDYDGHPDLWRIFNIDFSGDVSTMPQETSLQRAYCKLVAEGGKTGYGKGIILYRNGAKIT